MADREIENPALESLLSVGLTFIVDAEPSMVSRRRFSSMLRGWHTGEYLFMQAPSERQYASDLQQNQVCVVRFMAHGQACAFTSSILDMGTGAYYSFFRFTWPKTFQTVPIRRNERVELHAPCLLINEGGGAISGETIDMSLGGCKVLVQAAVGKGLSFKLCIELPAESTLEEAPVKVCSVSPAPDGHILGLAFGALTEIQRSGIEFFLGIAQAGPSVCTHRRPWVLMIEPNPDSVASLRELFRQHDIDVATTDNPVSAMARLGYSLPVAILMSYELGACTGVDVCRILSASPRLAKMLKFVYGKDGGDVRAIATQAKQAGATAYVPTIERAEGIVKVVSDAIRAGA